MVSKRSKIIKGQLQNTVYIIIYNIYRVLIPNGLFNSHSERVLKSNVKQKWETHKLHTRSQNSYAAY